MDNASLYESSAEQIRKIAKKFKLSESKVDFILKHERLIEVNIPFKTDEGEEKKITGFRMQHNSHLGPYKGGIRFHPNVSRDEVMALSLWMSLKCAVIGLPLGGGKGGVIIEPKGLTASELERLSRGYAAAIYDAIGPFKDIPAPDVNTNAKIIEWMVDEYVKIAKKRKEYSVSSWGSFTGKPVALHGLSIREQATGFGGVVVMTELARMLKKPPKDLKIAVQGFGNVGYFFSKIASEKGFSVVSVSDSKGAIINNDHKPLDIDLVMDCKKKQGYLAGCYCVGGVCDLTKGRPITNEAMLELPVDIIVPSALEDVINESNMKAIRAKIIVEMANGPVSPAAYEYLTKKGVIIVPDILANAGGVTASWIEWKQNTEGKKYSKNEALELLTKKMKNAFLDTWNKSKKCKSTLREAALLVALERLFE